MKNIFQPSLIGAKEVLKNQLELAEAKGQLVEKVILTGGFGQSPSLQSYLRTYLSNQKDSEEQSIDLIVPQCPSVHLSFRSAC